jgi:aminoglycoside phosphotransferase (APT) family kinase protein
MNLNTYLPRVTAYLNRSDLATVPGWQNDSDFQVYPLAQGEYNMNYRLAQGDRCWVVRVNTGTQIGREDQIAYEYRALRLLASSGVTPRPYYLDDRKDFLEYGLLIMEYLPGEPLDYRRDLPQAAGLFARLHSLDTPGAETCLMREDRPLTGMYIECERMAKVYLCSDLADPFVCRYLSKVLAWANQARAAEAYYLSDPCHRVVNTEVNSGNFIVNRQAGMIHLVDWEKPLWGDPAQDLSHFCAPTTTLWKTDYRMSERDRDDFLAAYRNQVADRHLRDTIVERVRLVDPFNCLRGVSWSAMAWVLYQSDEHALRNADTFRKIQAYLEPAFLRSLFDRYLNSSN